MRTGSTGRMRRGAVALTATACVLTTASCTSGGGSGESAASGSAAASASESGRGAYLALGDSVPFGFQGGAMANFSDAENFVGYPELVGEELGLDVINASCPGETTASFLDATAQSNGCQNSLQSDFGYRRAYPLHVPYEPADQSQLDFALDTLTENDDVELVTSISGPTTSFSASRRRPAAARIPWTCRRWRGRGRRTSTASCRRCAARAGTTARSSWSPTTGWTTPTRSGT